MNASSDTPTSDTSPTTVLIVLTSNNRRGAEIEGSRLALELREKGVHAEATALAPGTGTSLLDVPVLGRKTLGVSTLRALRSRARQYDVVIAYGSTSLPACAMALAGSSVPFVYRSIGDPSAWARGRWHRWRTGILMRRAEAIVGLWPGAADSIEQLYSIDAKRLSVIPNARSSNEFRPPTETERVEARASLGLPVDRQIVGCVGSISAEKRLQLAVGAVAGLPDAHLLVVGDGPERRNLEREAKAALGDRVTFTGVLDDVVPAYRSIDLLLLTSSTEGMPGVILEASMSGVPVVATDVGAVSDMFEAGVAGSCIPESANTTSVRSAIEAVLVEPPTAAAVTALRFGWPAVVDAWIEQLSCYRSEPNHIMAGPLS
jgi:glycosyltransferase involved in cell wall biosynthesis